MKKVLLYSFIPLFFSFQCFSLSWTPDFMQEGATTAVIIMDAENWAFTSNVYVNTGVIIYEKL